MSNLLEFRDKEDSKRSVLFTTEVRVCTEADKQVVEDLLDTLRANQDRCVDFCPKCGTRF